MAKLYFAASLFNEMELAFNALLAGRMREELPGLEVFLPQEQGEINDKNAYADSKMIAKLDTEAILKSDVLFAVLDGQVIDPGVASEIGVAYQAGIPIVALYSDTRQQGGAHPEKLAALQVLAESQFSYVNLYTVGLVKLNGKVVASSSEAIEAIKQYI
ncbi:nucleoside 2-deoxyribosyltransferase [Fundicoccus sp. Sow4_D5]|uniref:nucleoside 2-deoxyribosyltransferase n=1 Tax=Fundicoccus sp. Sow4_D5 TaxID=3438782 RepID=UPI003F93860C